LAGDSNASSILGTDDVQFTVYRPCAVRPGKWYSLLAYAHLARRRDGDSGDHPDPVVEVERQARAALAELAGAYTKIRQDSGQPIPKGGAMSFPLELPGVEVNPPSRAFYWVETIHKEEFRLRAPAELAGQTVRGRLTALLGPLLLAELTVAIAVDDA